MIGRQDDTIDTIGDKVSDDIDLARRITFALGTFPKNLNVADFLRSSFGASVDRLPELMTGAFGDNGKSQLPSLPPADFPAVVELSFVDSQPVKANEPIQSNQ